MTREQRGDETAHMPDKGEGGKDPAKHQGIVRDERGQEQPADKERAQRAVKGDEPG